MQHGTRLQAHLLPACCCRFRCLQPVWAEQPRETKRVLVLYSEDRAHPAHELTDQGIRSAFRSNTLFDVQLYSEYLDVTRFSGSANLQAFADYLRRKYSGTEIDTIITVYPAAVEFLLREAIAVFPDTPIVANQVSRAYAAKLKALRAAPRYHRHHHGGQRRRRAGCRPVRMRPGTKRVAIVGGTAPNNVYSEQVFRKGLEPYLEKIELIDLTKLSMEETLTRVGSLPPDTIVLYAAISSDGKGRSFVPREALSDISRAANAPVFGLYDSFMGYGIVGGRLVSWEQLGREAAGMALRIMAGSRRHPSPSAESRHTSISTTGGSSSAGASPNRLFPPAAKSATGCRRSGRTTGGASSARSG